jgi:hypothetical protein
VSLPDRRAGPNHNPSQNVGTTINMFPCLLSLQDCFRVGSSADCRLDRQREHNNRSSGPMLREDFNRQCKLRSAEIWGLTPENILHFIVFTSHDQYRHCASKCQD